MSTLPHLKTYLCLAVAFLFQSLFSQDHSESPIPSPFSNVVGAETFPAPDGSIFVIGLAETLRNVTSYSTSFESRLFMVAYDPFGQFGSIVALDSGARGEESFASSFEDKFRVSCAHNHSGSTTIVWKKQRRISSDIVFPRVLQQPQVSIAFNAYDAVRIVSTTPLSNNPHVTADSAGDFHVVWESVAPLHPIGTDWIPYGPDSNYYFETSAIMYRMIHADGQSDSVIELGKGFRPHIHADAAGTVSVTWLRADSSNAPVFQLAIRKVAAGIWGPTTIIVDSVQCLQESGINSLPPEYRSFVDDSANMFAAWTDVLPYSDSRITVAKYSPDADVQIDSLFVPNTLGQAVEIVVDRYGIAFALWNTWDNASEWTMHYSRSEPGRKLFSEVRDFHSPKGAAMGMTIVLNSQGTPNCVFDDGIDGIGYLRNLDAGKDSVIRVSPGSSLYNGISHWNFDSPETPGMRASIDVNDRVVLALDGTTSRLAIFSNALTEVASPPADIPLSAHLLPNYPNPFNPTTVIHYVIPEQSFVTVTVVDILGRTVRILVDRVMPAGTHRTEFDGNGLASGVYLYRLSTGRFSTTRTMLLLK